MKVEVHAERLMSDPAFVAYHVEIEHDGIWRETVGSEHDLTMLLRGLRAGWTMATGGYLPELPTPRPGDTHTVIGRAWGWWGNRHWSTPVPDDVVDDYAGRPDWRFRGVDVVT